MDNVADQSGEAEERSFVSVQSQARPAERAMTRTVAILAGPAGAEHRAAIQTRITSNGFEILAERLEVWSSEEDLSFLQEFFRDPSPDAATSLKAAQEAAQRAQWIESLTDRPIYVMALQRSRAAQMWLDMCGENDSNGLRAQYGADALYGSPPHLAERQVAICFVDLASCEALAALNLHPNGGTAPTTVTGINSRGAFLLREDGDIVYDEQGCAFDAHSGEPLELRADMSIGKEALSPSASHVDMPLRSTTFKARPLPAHHGKAVIQPRLSRAAALRMGVAPPLPSSSQRAQSTMSSNQDNASRGSTSQLRTNVPVPKSLAAPSITPRMNRSAAVRAQAGGGGHGHAATASSISSVSTTTAIRERRPVDFSNTPGHKRASTGFQLASLAAPSVVPRLNKAAAARTSIHQGGGGGGSHDTSTPRPARPSSVQSRQGISHMSTGGSMDKPMTRRPVDFSNTPGHKRLSMSTSTLKSLQAPTIVPRGNRASLARIGGIAGESDKPTHTAHPSSPLADGKSANVRRYSAMPSLAVPVDKENLAARHSTAPSSIGGGEARLRRPVDFSTTPGHKRATQSISTIASLAQPSIVPRSNAAAQKRLSMGGVGAASAMANRSALRNGPPPSSFRA